MQLLTTPKSRTPFYRNHLLRDAISQAIYDAMASDDSVHMFGEGASVKAHYDAPQIERDFGSRVHTLPISEDGNTNFCVGASLVGVKPIVDVISSDFMYRAMDSIANTAAKLGALREQQSTIVIRAEFLTGGPTTGQHPEALFAAIPGLRVAVPSTPRDAYGLMRTALETPGVSLIFEDRMIDDEGPWAETDLRLGEPVPFGVIRCRQQAMHGHVAILTYGIMRQRVERILKSQPWVQDPHDENNLRADLYDLRSIYPIEWKGINLALRRAARLLIVEPDIVYGGVGAEIAAQAHDMRPGVQVKRLGAPRAVIPASPELHRHLLPSDEEVISAITKWD